MKLKKKQVCQKPPGYRYAKQVGNQLHVSGQTPQNKSGVIVDVSNPYKQAQQCLTNLELLLYCHNFSKNDIQHITIYVVGNSDNLNKVWKSVREKFKNEVPPATLLGFSLLGHKNQLVEIDAKVSR